MNRVVIHLAVPVEKRAVAGTMAGLSGDLSEHSVSLIALPGMVSDTWNVEHNQDSQWWGASHPIEASIAQAMLASGVLLQTQSWYAAFHENTGQLIQHNLPVAPADKSFPAFLDAAGLLQEVIDPPQ